MITQYPNNILSKKSRAVNPVTRADAATLQAMADIMKKTDGLGLAAPQIGINRRMIVAIKNLKNATVINGTSWAIILPATKVPPQNKVTRMSLA